MSKQTKVNITVNKDPKMKYFIYQWSIYFPGYRNICSWGNFQTSERAVNSAKEFCKKFGLVIGEIYDE